MELWARDQVPDRDRLYLERAVRVKSVRGVLAAADLAVTAGV